MDVVVPVLVHMSVVTMVEFWLRSIKLHYSPADFQSQEETSWISRTMVIARNKLAGITGGAQPPSAAVANPQQAFL